MRHFPLRNDRFEHDFGVRAIPPGEGILDRTRESDQEVALKCELLEKDLPNYFQALPESSSACEEAASMLASQASPDAVIDQDSTSRSHDADCPGLALLNVARTIQEDVVVLRGDEQQGDEERGHPILAGVVCFPSGWSIADKVGLSILSTHAPVPEYQSVLSTSTERLLAKLKVNRPVWRTNWGVRCSPRLDQSPKHAIALAQELASLRSDNVGDRCYFRVERQTLSRLPTSRAILFTIHTYQAPLRELSVQERQILHGVLKTCPDATLHYKGIAPMRELLIDYLR